MNSSRATALALACLLAAVWVGVWLGRLLPDNYLTPDDKDTVKLAMGLVSTMAALLLGLLVNSAKTAFDTTRNQVIQKAAKFTLLDRMLTLYGPDATEARAVLRALTEESTRLDFPDDPHLPTQSVPEPEMGGVFYCAVQKLEPQDEAQHALKAQAVGLTLELGQLRSLMQAESSTSIPKPLLVVVVLWLVIIFLGFGLIAPPNAVATVALIASALCAASAIFLMLEMDRPFGGFMRVSSEPMLEVLRRLGKSD